uniref:helix-turn-helix domain-containing protein n=1 Tax=Culturomica massiliensis TaxID=1841857 RepID=UPI002666FED8
LNKLLIRILLHLQVEFSIVYLISGYLNFTYKLKIWDNCTTYRIQNIFSFVTQFITMRTKIELDIIARVKKMREVHGYTQEALSYALGFERTFINKYERGLRCYNYNHLNALAKIFKCSPRDFLPENPI